MTTKTQTKYGDPVAMVHQAAGLFAAHNTRNSTISRLTGPMPKGTTGATATLRKQSTQHMPIVRCQDLGKGRGDEVTFHLLNPVGAKPIMGSRYAEGRGVGMKLSEDRLRVDQARFPVDLGDVMTQIRSPHDFRNLGRPVAQGLMDKYVDQSIHIHMAGARGFHNNIEWVVPTTADADFADIMVNTVKAPTMPRPESAITVLTGRLAQLAGSLPGIRSAIVIDRPYEIAATLPRVASSIAVSTGIGAQIDARLPSTANTPSRPRARR